MKKLQARAKGGWPLGDVHRPEAGGTGTGFLPYAYLNEIIGRSLWAQRVFGCQAPDTATPRSCTSSARPSRRRAGCAVSSRARIRSFFAMTEPEVSGSDPRGLRARAVREAGEWVINAHKWFSSGAEGAAFGIVMAVTDPEAPRTSA